MPSLKLIPYLLLPVLIAFTFLLPVHPLYAQPITGPYIAGEGGATFNQDNRVLSTPDPHNHSYNQAKGVLGPSGGGFPDGRDRWRTGGLGIGSAGYGFGDGFRLEMEGNYRTENYKGFVTNTLQNEKAGGRRRSYGMMANALYDLDVGQNCIYPYFGAGIGYGWTTMNTNMTADSIASRSLNPGNIISRSTNQHVAGKYGNFTYQGIFGLSFPIPRAVGLSVTAEYRFWTMFGKQKHNANSYGTVAGTYDSLNAIAAEGERMGNHNTRTDFNHSLMLGLRYEFDPPPPPPIPHIANSTPPPPTPKQSYRIYFNWHDATLTDRARQILNHAAQAEPHVILSQIIISNYDKDSVQLPPQMEELHDSELLTKRAEAIKEELIRDGISGGKIKTYGFWEPDAVPPKIANNKKDTMPRSVNIIFR